MPPDPPATLAATPLVGQTNARPFSPKKENFLTRTPMNSHGMIKFGRANSPNISQQNDGSVAPEDVIYIV